MTPARGLLARLRPRSFRAWTALGIIASLAVIFVAQSVLSQLLEDRAKQEVERTLDRQAAAVLAQVTAATPPDRDSVARRAANMLTDTRVKVKDGGVTVYWSQPSGATYAMGAARDGELEVTLERVDPISAVDRRVIFTVSAIGFGVAALVVWLVSGGLALRLRGRLNELSASADRVAEGHLDHRARVTDDEVGRLAETFNHMAARLEHDEARQRDFLADVAHELRTPVTAIEGFACALQDGTARSDDDRREAAGFIRDEAARMRTLVRELQELTWLDLDPPVRSEPVDLAELSREALARQRAAARRRGVELVGPEGTVRAFTDPAHVGTILGNLVSNAIAATPEGGRVEIRATGEGGDAVLTVTDTGVGISPEHLPYLFDRLFRVDASRVRGDDGGSGLGLSIVKRLAMLLGGRVTVQSQVGEGTTFTVWLLGAREDVQPPVAAQAAE
ncbi:MAG: HAMP domain-containing histidine kinase [Thermoleophilia bacterium]|nr:HAMP domain-containing histidine kinase [Thermoleophilia bacterium]